MQREQYILRPPSLSLSMILNLLDCATTMYIIAHGGVEANPFMARAIEWGIFPLLKLTVGMWGFWWLYTHSRKWHAIACGVYLLIVANNFYTIGVIMG